MPKRGENKVENRTTLETTFSFPPPPPCNAHTKADDDRPAPPKGGPSEYNWRSKSAVDRNAAELEANLEAARQRASTEQAFRPKDLPVTSAPPAGPPESDLPQPPQESKGAPTPHMPSREQLETAEWQTVPASRPKPGKSGSGRDEIDEEEFGNLIEEQQHEPEDALPPLAGGLEVLSGELVDDAPTSHDAHESGGAVAGGSSLQDLPPAAPHVPPPPAKGGETQSGKAPEKLQKELAQLETESPVHTLPLEAPVQPELSPASEAQAQEAPSSAAASKPAASGPARPGPSTASATKGRAASKTAPGPGTKSEPPGATAKPAAARPSAPHTGEGLGLGAAADRDEIEPEKLPGGRFGRPPGAPVATESGSGPGGSARLPTGLPAAEEPEGAATFKNDAESGAKEIQAQTQGAQEETSAAAKEVVQEGGAKAKSLWGKLKDRLSDLRDSSMDALCAIPRPLLVTAALATALVLGGSFVLAERDTHAAPSGRRRKGPNAGRIAEKAKATGAELKAQVQERSAQAAKALGLESDRDREQDEIDAAMQVGVPL